MGSDFCGTKFTIEDLDNRVASFGFRRDFLVIEKKREAIKKVIYPWIFFIVMLSHAYIGFLVFFLRNSNPNLFLRFLSSLLVAAMFASVAFVPLIFSIWFIIPVVIFFNLCFKSLNNALYSKLVYRSKEEQDQENRMAQKVRKSDPLFSIQSFFGGVQNKLYAIHFAVKKNQINAFSDLELSSNLLEKYEKVVDIETVSLSMTSYRIEEGVQIATVTANLLLRKFEKNKIKDREERVELRLEKSEHCKTQVVCGPSILKCKKCGGNLSLLEGKICKFCGNELDMKEHDWVITEYSSMQEQK